MDEKYRNKKALWIFRGIAAFSVLCLLLAIDVHRLLGYIHPSLGKLLSTLLTIPATLLSPVYDLLLWAGQRLDPLVDGDTRSTVFSMLGLAASIIPPVYKAEATRRHGILVKEMIDCYFPHYKFILMANFILSLAGQHIAEKDKWIYLFMAIAVTAVYSVFLLQVSGFDEKKSEQKMQEYIQTKGNYLFPSDPGEADSEQRIEQIRFIADISSFLAQKISETKTCYWQTDPQLKQKLRSAVELILRHGKINWDKVNEQPVPSPQKSNSSNDEAVDFFLTDFKSFFNRGDHQMEDWGKALYYQIPKALGPQAMFADAVELAGVFWKNLLAPAGNLRAKADVVCRVYDAINPDSTPASLKGGFLILGCGLIRHLYQESQTQVNRTSANGSADLCARFVEQMHNIYLTDKPTIPLPGSLKADKHMDVLECLCRDHMLLVWCVSEVEQYLQARRRFSCEAARIIHDYSKHVSSGIIMSRLFDSDIIFFLSLAMCLIQCIPSPANRKLSLLHKRRLMSYILSRKETIGAWNDVSY